MDSSSGISSNSSGLQNSGSEEDLQLLMDQRKRKRMISNRESARRSRLRKQKHLDDLMAQVSQLRKENHQILTGLNVTTQQYLNVESENAILRAQAAELSHRLQSLNEIVSFLSPGGENDCFPADQEPAYGMAEWTGLVNSSWNCLSQPIMMTAAPADTGFLY
ncbi:bZIP transcription factor 44 [Sesamum alatum]|uniref:BZIP transcription factor 44 n=1 Tax=Sesamum alatum TaxID=300844 RepID=A0AAE1YXV1_9LAMI|nr:bZIP transcription factor 44 [Sesamum alatum]